MVGISPSPLQQALHGNVLAWLKKPRFGKAVEPFSYHSLRATLDFVLSMTGPFQAPQWWWHESRKMPCCGWLKRSVSTRLVMFLPKLLVVGASAWLSITLPVCQESYTLCKGNVGVLICSLDHCAKMHFSGSALWAAMQAAFKPAGDDSWNL